MTLPLCTADILHTIFRDLSATENLRIASTCKLWRQISGDPNIWKIYASRDWPCSFAQAQGIVDWKAWYRSHYFVAYSPLFTLNLKRAYSHTCTYCPEAYWKGIAFKKEAFVTVGQERNVSSFYTIAYVINRMVQQQKELLGVYEYKKGGSWPVIADDIVLMMNAERVFGFSMTKGNPYGTCGLCFEIENVLAFSSYENWVGLLLDGQIKLYNMLVNDPGRRGSYVKTFSFDKTETRPAFLHLTCNRIVALFQNHKLLIFDIQRHESPLAILPLKQGNWTIKKDLLYYLDQKQLSEIDLVTGTIKRTMRLPPHLTVKIFTNPGRMACAKDFLALMAGDAREKAEALFLYVVRLKDFTVTGSRQMDRTDGHLQPYENMLLIGRECDEHMNMKRKGVVGILDLESREFFEHLACSSFGARPFFYDGKIIAVSSCFIDVWKIDGTRTGKLRIPGVAE